MYSGMDPIAKRRMYLTEVVPAEPKAGDQAEKVRTRLLHQVDQKRNPGPFGESVDGFPQTGRLHARVR